MRLLSNCISNVSGQVEGFCLIKSVLVKSNVKGADYLDMIISDVDGEINAKLWDYSPSLHGMYSMGDIIKVRGTINMWKDTEQLRIDRIRHKRDDDMVDMSSLVPSAPVDCEAAFSTLYDFAGSFGDGELTRLTQYILRTHKEAILSHPAALKLHHATRGGLLHHTTTMLEVAKHIVGVYKKIYPELSSDLVYAGIILHDVAKTEELLVGEFGLATAYSTRGQLIGHINLGVAMVEKAAAELSVSEETATLISHILLSHHGQPDFGSPKQPMFPEAEIVADVDMLDARMFEMFDALSSVEVGAFTDRQWALDNRQLYRHGHVLKTSDAE